MTLPASQPNYFDSTEVGIPAINNVAGSGLEAIRACLKNGFNPRVVTSIVVASGVATATAASHGYTDTYGKLLLIEGSGEALLNGRKQPLSVATNTFTYAAPGVADGTYTGTMSAKRAPLGWTEKFTGTNTAIFKRPAIEATTIELRINDSHANGSTVTDMRVVMVESSTDVDTYTAPSPTAAQVSGGLFWSKGSNNATAKQWSLVGDHRRFFFTIQLSAVVLPVADGAANTYFFGDFASLKAGDAYNTVLFGSESATSGGTGNNPFGLSTSGSTAYGGVVARSHSQVGSSVQVSTSGLLGVASGAANTQLPIYPSAVDSGAVMFPGMLLREYSLAQQHPVRGFIKPLVYFLSRYPLSHKQVVDTVDNLPGRKIIALATSNAGVTGQIGVDLTGPWD